MNNLTIFTNAEFGEFGIITVDGKPYFPASSCAKLLGYANPRKAIIDHCKGVTIRDALTEDGGIQKVNFIPEGDLYRLIARSKLPAAERFERWIFDEVLPQIRKTGGYNVPYTNDERVKIARVLAKTPKHAMPHVLAALGLPVTDEVTVTTVTPQNDALDKFLAGYDVLDKPTKQVYDAYCAKFPKNPIRHIEFSKQVNRRMGTRTCGKRVGCEVCKVFVR